MASEISNIAGLFCVDSTASVIPADKNTKVQNDFSTFLNTGAFGQNVAQNYKTDANAATAGATYDRYQYKAGAAIKSASHNGISAEKISEVKDKLGTFAEDVKNVLKEELGVTDEQIKDAMAVLGMQVTDLMDSKNLAALVTELTGCDDPMQLLMTEGFQEIMGSMEEISSALLDELGMSKEEFLAACDEILAENTEPVSEDVSAEPPAAETEVVAEKATDVTAKTEPETDRTEMAQKTLTETTGTEKAAPKQEETTQTKQPVERAGKSEQPVEEADTEIAAGTTIDSDGQETTDLDFSDETENSNADAYMNSQTHVTEQHIQQPARVDVPETANQAPVQTYVDVQDIIEQISTYTRVMSAGDTNVLEMQLNPENLGKIYIHVTEKAGTITAQISATNENVREALQAQVADLKTNLNQQGIKVDAVEVTIENHEFEQNLEQNAGREQKRAEQEEEQRSAGNRRNINLADPGSLDGTMTEEESLTAKIMQENGNQMDVTA